MHDRRCSSHVPPCRRNNALGRVDVARVRWHESAARQAYSQAFSGDIYGERFDATRTDRTLDRADALGHRRCRSRRVFRVHLQHLALTVHRVRWQATLREHDPSTHSLVHKRSVSRDGSFVVSSSHFAGLAMTNLAPCGSGHARTARRGRSSEREVVIDARAAIGTLAIQHVAARKTEALAIDLVDSAGVAKDDAISFADWFVRCAFAC